MNHQVSNDLSLRKYTANDRCVGKSGWEGVALLPVDSAMEAPGSQHGGAVTLENFIEIHSQSLHVWL